jgi:hypothetical protein
MGKANERAGGVAGNVSKTMTLFGGLAVLRRQIRLSARQLGTQLRHFVELTDPGDYSD